MATDTEKSRSARSKRHYLDADGKPVESPFKAVGFRYENLAQKGEDCEVYFRDLSEEQRNALAAFGGLTIVGNVTNKVRADHNKGKQTKDKDWQEPPAGSEKFALDEWYTNLLENVWSTGESVASNAELAAVLYQQASAQGFQGSEEDMLEMVRGMDDAQKDTFRKEPGIALILKERRHARELERLKSQKSDPSLIANLIKAVQG